MSVYSVKLLELLSIKEEADKYFLHIRLSFEQDIEILWEIDKYTGENLKTVTDFDEKSKYRLSFHKSFDTLKSQHRSILTRTYRDQSDRIYFSCSEDYINTLTDIKHCQHAKDLNTFTFTSMNPVPVYEKQIEQKEQKKKIMSFKKSNRKFTWTSVAAMSVAFGLIFSYSNHISLDKTTFKDEALAQSMVLTDEVELKNENTLELQDTSLDELENNSLVENVSSEQPAIPCVELSEAIAYGLSEGKVALTFDDGPSQYSMDIMNVLKRYNAGGTFFFIGLNVEKYPDYVKHIYLNGYSIGTHSMNHVDVSNLSYENQEIEIMQSSTLLEKIINEKVTLFRPPYGSFNKGTKDLIRDHQYKMVLWNNDPKDWETRDAGKILSDIQHSDVSGSIILLHESQAVVDALPKVIEYLQELNLEIVSLH